MSETREPYIITPERLDLIEAAAQPNERGLVADSMTLGLVSALREARTAIDRAWDIAHERRGTAASKVGRIIEVLREVKPNEPHV